MLLLRAVDPCYEEVHLRREEQSAFLHQEIGNRISPPLMTTDDRWCADLGAEEAKNKRPMWPHVYAPLTLLRRFRSGDGLPALFIHRCYSREVWRTRGRRIGLDLLAAVVVWSLSTLGAMGWLTWRNSAMIKQRTGKGRLRQLREHLSLAISASIPPCGYYVFELHDDDKRRQASQYLQRREMKARSTPS